jgi:photosystem II stability/assembly factor-like uncharacterized protein
MERKMRTLKISLLIFIFSITISAQWYQQNSGTTDNLYNVYFVSELVGWATTYQVIYKTTDGGQSWQYQYTQNPVFQIFFHSENVGWISTWLTGPAILETTNGGDSWVDIYSILGSYEFIHDFEFISPDTGWIVGEETIMSGKDDSREFPVLFKETTDGGLTWLDKNFPPDYWGRLVQIDAIDYMNLIVAGDDTLFKTSDGGNNWQQVPLPQNFQPTDLNFINEYLGWVYGPNALYKTTNGGVSWEQQAQPVYNFQFITAQIGWYTVFNQIYYSTDSGDSWTLQNSNTNNTLNDIFFINNNIGWAVGQNGTILHTNNGGTPVELISFIAEAFESKVELIWSTATETNNSGFEILRFDQNDNDGWNKIGFVPGHGTTTETQHYSFIDNDVKPGKYQYKLKQIDYDGTFEYSQIVEVEIPLVNEFSLSQNYPNPFNPTTKIKYQIPLSPPLLKGESEAGGFVTLKVYDLLGREVATLVNEEKPAGEYEIEFTVGQDSSPDIASGIYFYQLKAGEYFETRKMILLK